MSSRIRSSSSSKRRPPLVESLENRQMLSLTVDLRLPGGGKAATVTGVGQVINLEIWATAKGSNSTTSDEALQIAVGSLLSSNINGGAANGTLKATLKPPFDGFGSSNGIQRDLDGDGDLDVGTNDTTDGSSFFAARYGDLHPGTTSGSTKVFQIGTATFTVTSLKSTTGQTNLSFRTRNSGGTGAIWKEDGVLKREFDGTYTGGSPVVIKRSGSTTGGAAISGTLFSDTDKDGNLDSGEPRLGSRKMYIDANKNGKLDSGEKTSITNSSGAYSFSNLASGSYRVRRADTPAGYGFSFPSSGYHDVSLSTNQQVSGKNFGVIPLTSTGGAAISGTLFSDTDKDGNLDSGEPRLGSRKMYIDANKNGKLDSGEKTSITNSSGAYSFSNLASGSYRVRRADTPAGYGFSFPSSGYHDVSLSTNQQVSGKNFGVIPLTSTSGAKITGTVFSDNDKDGVLDASDTRLANRRMYIDANKNGKLDSGEKSVLTSSSGVYSFTGLAAGSYRIRRADVPGGYGYTVPSSGYYDILLGTGATASGKNFGFKSL